MHRLLRMGETGGPLPVGLPLLSLQDLHQHAFPDGLGGQKGVSNPAAVDKQDRLLIVALYIYRHEPRRYLNMEEEFGF